MGGIGESAGLHRQQLVTWAEARDFLDRRFTVLRFRGYNARANKPCQQFHWVKMVNEQWRIATLHLKAALCPQKPRKHFYRPVNTVNFEGKVKPSRSAKRRQERGRLAKNRGYRSHHKGTYSPKQAGRGRPKLQPEIAKANAAKSAEKKARKRKQKHPPKRKYTKRGTARAPIKKFDTFKLTVAEARAIIKVKPFKDKRGNHDTAYAYAHPQKRMRAKKGKHSPPGIRAGKTAGNANASGVLILRAIVKGISKSRKQRAYWKRIKATRKAGRAAR